MKLKAPAWEGSISAGTLPEGETWQLVQWLLWFVGWSRPQGHRFISEQLEKGDVFDRVCRVPVLNMTENRVSVC